jgi:hypothetical protein
MGYRETTGKEDIKETAKDSVVEYAEVEIDLSLINKKLKYIISLLQPKV